MRSRRLLLKAIICVVLCLGVVGCASVGPRYVSPEPTAAETATVVIYRSNELGASGEWVPTRVEINQQVAGSLPSDSYLVIRVRAGDVILAATEMVGFHYNDENRMTQRVKLAVGETAYFWTLGGGIIGCAATFEKFASPGFAVARYFGTSRKSRGSSATCFGRVSEAVGQKAIQTFNRAS